MIIRQSILYLSIEILLLSAHLGRTGGAAKRSFRSRSLLRLPGWSESIIRALLGGGADAAAGSLSRQAMARYHWLAGRGSRAGLGAALAHQLLSSRLAAFAKAWKLLGNWGLPVPKRGHMHTSVAPCSPIAQ
jgi:hypothetical protein